MNTELAQRVIDHVLAHPDRHDQRTFGYGDGTECGTTACVAGWAILLSGHTIREDEEDAIFKLDGENVDSDDVVNLARNLLGISQRQADALFYEMSGTRAIDKLRLYIRSNGYDE